MARILCIDDDRDVLETCKIILTTEKHNVMMALNGNEGFAKAKAEIPELILLDVMMDDNTEGFHTAYKLRKDPVLKFVPILMLTSVNQKLNMKCNPKKDGNFLPVDAFLEKPVEKVKLLKEVKRLLALKKDEINIDGN